MFIRRKIKILKGQSYEQHQLLKSVRTDRGPRQEVVLNMGALDLPKHQWKDLADAIEDQLNNQAPFYFEEGCPEVKKLAAHFAQMIVSKSLNEKREEEQENTDASPGEPSPGPVVDYQKVDINSVKTSELKSAAKAAQLGEYIIRTDRLDLSEEDISGIHRSLTTVESSFRAMKSDLGLRPNYHKCEEATIAHIFLSVLAYHMVCPVRNNGLLLIILGGRRR